MALSRTARSSGRSQPTHSSHCGDPGPPTGCRGSVGNESTLLVWSLGAKLSRTIRCTSGPAGRGVSGGVQSWKCTAGRPAKWKVRPPAAGAADTIGNGGCGPKARRAIACCGGGAWASPAEVPFAGEAGGGGLKMLAAGAVEGVAAASGGGGGCLATLASGGFG